MRSSRSSPPRLGLGRRRRLYQSDSRARAWLDQHTTRLGKILKRQGDIGEGLFSMKEDLKRVKVAFVGFSVLVLLTPWLYGQNPDELLVVRLPAQHGHINEPGAAPIPGSAARLQITAPRRTRKCGSIALAVAQRSPVKAIPVRPKANVNLVVNVPAARIKRRAGGGPEEFSSALSLQGAQP